MTNNRLITVAGLYSILFLSGFAGLGHEILAVLAVIAAFFSGLALGAYGLDGIVSRSRVPGRWYVVLEGIIGAWSLALIALIPRSHRLVATLMGVEPSPIQHWAIAFLVPFALLLPATTAMGATLPAMERLLSRLRHNGWSVGGLYAANTFGAVASTLVTTFLIVPQLGSSRRWSSWPRSISCAPRACSPVPPAVKRPVLRSPSPSLTSPLRGAFT